MGPAPRVGVLPAGHFPPGASEPVLLDRMGTKISDRCSKKPLFEPKNGALAGIMAGNTLHSPRAGNPARRNAGPTQGPKTSMKV
jgi:hypothetical protein